MQEEKYFDGNMKREGLVATLCKKYVNKKKRKLIGTMSACEKRACQKNIAKMITNQ